MTLHLEKLPKHDQLFLASEIDCPRQRISRGEKRRRRFVWLRLDRNEFIDELDVSFAKSANRCETSMSSKEVHAPGSQAST
jgi:hypothetical protein